MDYTELAATLKRMPRDEFGKLTRGFDLLVDALRRDAKEDGGFLEVPSALEDLFLAEGMCLRCAYKDGGQVRMNVHPATPETYGVQECPECDYRVIDYSDQWEGDRPWDAEREERYCNDDRETDFS